MIHRMPLMLALLIVMAEPAVVLGAEPPVGPSFNCARAATPVERAICGDPQLAAQDAALGRAYAQALAATPNPRSLRTDQHRWITDVRDHAPDLHAAYADRLAFLQASTSSAAALRTPRDEAAVRATCLPLVPGTAVEDRCQVLAFGAVTGAADLAYQSQYYRLGDSVRGRAVVVLERQPDGRLRPLVWDSGPDLKFGTPVLLRSPAGVLLDLPADSADDSGLGTGNLESLYVRRDGAWHLVDSTSWQRDLLARVGKSYRIIRDIYPDWTSMTAQSDLWEIYANGRSPAAPHGGSVQIRLRLAGDAVVIADYQRSNAQLPDQ
jgi:uncharacterized protein